MEINFRYNTGAIVRPAFEDGNHGRVHNFIWSLPLSLHARALLAWADSRPTDWIPRVDNIREVLRWSETTWARVRDELVEAACLSSTHTRKDGDQRTTHELKFNLMALLLLVIETEKPPPKNGGSRSPKGAGSRDPSEMGDSHDPSKTGALTTTSETRLRNHDQQKPGSGEEDGRQVRFALAPASAERVAALGTRLVDVLDMAEQKRVDKASAGATEEQLQLAVFAVRASLAKGSVKSVAGLAVTLGKMAVRGEVGDVATASTPTPATDPWPGREARARTGLSVLHSFGVLVAEPGARAWRHRGGERDGQPVTGKDALKVWERVESGELNPLVTT